MELLPKISVRRLAAYTGHTGSVFALALATDEQTLFSGGDDGVLASWDLGRADQTAQAVLRAASSIYALHPLGDTGQLAAGTSDGTLYIVDLVSRQVVHTYRPENLAIYGLWFDAALNRLWVLHAQGMLSVLETVNWTTLHYARLSSENLRSIVPHGQSLWIGTGEGKIYQLDRERGEIAGSWNAHSNTVFCLAHDPVRSQLFSGGRDAFIKSWSVPEMEQVLDLPAHNFTVNDLVFSPDHSLLVSASRDRTLKVWEPGSGKLLKVIDWDRNQGHKHSVNRLQWRNPDNSLFSCSDDKLILRWKLELTPA